MSDPATDEALRKAVGAIETMAPKAWELLVRYERMDALADLLGQLTAIGVSALVIWLFVRLLRATGVDEDDVDSTRLVAWVIWGIVVSIVSAFIPMSVVHYLNADSCAARVLVEKATK